MKTSLHKKKSLMIAFRLDPTKYEECVEEAAKEGYEYVSQWIRKIIDDQLGGKVLPVIPENVKHIRQQLSLTNLNMADLEGRVDALENKLKRIEEKSNSRNPRILG